MKTSLSPAIKGFRDWIRKARFASVSLAIHVLLVLIFGSVVLFKAAQETDSFVASGNFLTPSDEDDSGAPEKAEPAEFEEAATSQESSDQSAMMQSSALASLTEA